MQTSQSIAGTEKVKLLIPPVTFTNRIDDFGFEFLTFENRKLAAGETFHARTGER